MNSLTLLTTTGARYEAWEICEILMSRQTFKGSVRWVVVDDGKVPQQINFKKHNWKIEVLRPIPYWKHGMNTQSRNLLTGLNVIGNNERLVIIEDDDWYSPKYLSEIDKWLNSSDLVGEAKARYFNVSTGMGKKLSNINHSSLCSTALKGNAIEILRICSNNNFQYIDIELWKSFRGNKRLYNSEMVVGIKGLPGRHGIGAGHKPNFGIPIELKNWIGNDIDLYEQFIPVKEMVA